MTRAAVLVLPPLLLLLLLSSAAGDRVSAPAANRTYTFDFLMPEDKRPNVSRLSNR